VGEPQQKDDRKTTATKSEKQKKGQQQEAQTVDKPTDDADPRTATTLTEVQRRRMAVERLWNVHRSPHARCNEDRLNKYSST